MHAIAAFRTCRRAEGIALSHRGLGHHRFVRSLLPTAAGIPRETNARAKHRTWPSRPLSHD